MTDGELEEKFDQIQNILIDVNQRDVFRMLLRGILAFSSQSTNSFEILQSCINVLKERQKEI